jgi:hypothetical protein
MRPHEQCRLVLQVEVTKVAAATAVEGEGEDACKARVGTEVENHEIK